MPFLNFNRQYFYVCEPQTAKWVESTESSHIPLGPMLAQPPPLLTFLITAIHLLQSWTYTDSSLLLKLHSLFTLEFTLDIVYGFQHMYNDMFTILESYSPENDLCSNYSSLPPIKLLLTTDLFPVFIIVFIELINSFK